MKSIKIKMLKFFVLFRLHKRIETKMMYKLHDRTRKDFLTICESICPDIKKLKKYFGKFGLEFHLSGSGPTVFCQVSDYRLVKKIAGGYPKFNGDIFICHPQKEAIKIL